LSQAVAGLALIFLVVAIPIYWILVIMFENKVFDVILCRRGARAETDVNAADR